MFRCCRHKSTHIASTQSFNVYRPTMLINQIFIQPIPVKTCNISDFPSACPPSTLCVQIQDTNNEIGNCKCDENLKFNVNYVNDIDYCIEDVESKVSTIKPDADTTTEFSGKDTIRIFGGHHIVSGILIPMLIFLIIVGIACGGWRLYARRKRF